MSNPWPSHPGGGGMSPEDVVIDDPIIVLEANQRLSRAAQEAILTLRELHLPDPGYPTYCTWCDGKSKYPCEHAIIADELEKALA